MGQCVALTDAPAVALLYGGGLPRCETRGQALPPAVQALLDELRADREAHRPQLEAQSRALEEQNRQLAKLNDGVSNLTKMLRRREAKNKRLERENRKLRSASLFAGSVAGHANGPSSCVITLAETTPLSAAFGQV